MAPDWLTGLMLLPVTFHVGASTITKTHVTTTQITIHGVGVSEDLNAASSLVNRIETRALDANLPDSIAPSWMRKVVIEGVSESGFLWPLGTQRVPLTAGQVTTLGGTQFSLDTFSRTLYAATPNPYYVPSLSDGEETASGSSQASSAGRSASGASGQSISRSDVVASAQTLSATRSVSHASGQSISRSDVLESSQSLSVAGSQSGSSSQGMSRSGVSTKSVTSELPLPGSGLAPLPTPGTLKSSLQFNHSVLPSQWINSSSPTPEHIPSSKGLSSSPRNSKISELRSRTASVSAMTSLGDDTSKSSPNGTTRKDSVTSVVTDGTSSSSINLPETPSKTHQNSTWIFATSKGSTSGGWMEVSNTDSETSKGMTRPPTMTTSTGDHLNAFISQNYSFAGEEITVMTGQWREAASGVQCKPPCTLTLPPLSFNKPATLQYPPVTTSVCKELNGIVYTYATTISIPSAVVTELGLQPVPVGSMSSGAPDKTMKVVPLYPTDSCNIAMPSGTACPEPKYPVGDGGMCGPDVMKSCPDMQCCSANGTCGTDHTSCALDKGCRKSFGSCWDLKGQSFLPISVVFPPAKTTSSCPYDLWPAPTAGPFIAGFARDHPSGRICGACGLPGPPLEWRLDLGCHSPLCNIIVPRGGGCLGPLCDLKICLIGCGGGGGGGGGGKPPKPPKPPGGKPPPGGDDPKDPKDPDDPGDTEHPDVDPDDPEDPDAPEDPEDQEDPKHPTPEPSHRPKPTFLEESDRPKPTGSVSFLSNLPTASQSSESECETRTVTDITALCNIFTQFGMMGNKSTMPLARTTCTSTEKHMTKGCDVIATTTTKYDSCSATETATELTKYCTQSVSGGSTFTPCTKTISSVVKGCAVLASMTSIVDEACQTIVPISPEDPQGEFGTLPPDKPKNETCPAAEVSVLDDQGQDKKAENGTCPLFDGTIPSIDDDQGSSEKQNCRSGNGTMPDEGAAQSCPASNATLIQGPDGAEDGAVRPESCPLNSTLTQGDESLGALDNATMTAPSCGLFGANLTANLRSELENLGQGEEGDLGGSCPIGANITMQIDDDQGENGIRPSPRRNTTTAGSTRSHSNTTTSRHSSTLAPSGMPHSGNHSLSVASSSRSSTASGDRRVDCMLPISAGLGKCTIVVPEVPFSRKTTLPPPSTTPPPTTTSSESMDDFIDPAKSLLTQIDLPEPSRHGDDFIDPAKSLKDEASAAQSARLERRTAAANVRWSCSCENQKESQAVWATTICGTTVCPNGGIFFESHAPRPSRSGQNAHVSAFTTARPEPVLATCNCPVPVSTDLGPCTLIQDRKNAKEGAKADACRCFRAAGGQLVFPAREVCGQLVCPNQAPATTLTMPEKCPESARVEARAVAGLPDHYGARARSSGAVGDADELPLASDTLSVLATPGVVPSGIAAPTDVAWR